MKKRLGIVGGMGSLAGSWLFQRIVNLSNVKSDQDHLEIIIHNNTKIPDRTKAIVFNEESPLPELQRTLKLFEDGGVEVIVFACMTSYHYYDELVKSSKGEILHPIGFVVDELLNSHEFKSKKIIGLIGSTGLIKSGLFQKALEPLGFKVLTLDDEEQEKYFTEPIYKRVKTGTISDVAQDLFMQQIEIFQHRKVDLIIGACSEMPIFISQEKVKLPYIDVFELLATRVITHCYNN